MKEIKDQKEQVVLPRGSNFYDVPKGYRFIQCRCCNRMVWIRLDVSGYRQWCVDCNRGYVGD